MLTDYAVKETMLVIIDVACGILAGICFYMAASANKGKNEMIAEFNKHSENL